MEKKLDNSYFGQYYVTSMCSKSILSATVYQARIELMAKYAKYAYLGAYLGARNMVKWGVPEKILQNAVQTRWS